MALLLTLAAGCVDIVGFVMLYHVFTAHMTGVTVHLGEDAVKADWKDAGYAAAVVAAFLIGSVTGRAVIEYGARTRWRSIASATLLLEGALIAAVMLGVVQGGPSPVWSIVLASAMGLQTATLTRVGSLTVHTTFVTGMLNKLAQLLSHGVFLWYDRMRGRLTGAAPQPVFRQAGFIFAVWWMYLAGVVIGRSLVSRFHIWTLLLPLVAIAVALVMDQVVPLSIEEERDATEDERMFPDVRDQAA